MPEAYIIDAVRAPIGRKKGGLAHVHPADLGAFPIAELIRRTGVDANLVDDVVWGCTIRSAGRRAISAAPHGSSPACRSMFRG